MPILKSDFQAALDLDTAAEAAATLSSAKRAEAKQLRAELQTYLASMGMDPGDPFAVVLVEHEGTVYKVTPVDIEPLVVKQTTG